MKGSKKSKPATAKRQSKKPQTKKTEQNKPNKLFLVLLLVALLLGGLVAWVFGEKTPKDSDQVLIDDWQYVAQVNDETTSQNLNTTSGPTLAADASLGLAVGGAKDISNFRANVENGYLPVPTDISHEGLFYEYYFDSGQTQPCQELFCPSYSTAHSPDPISGQSEYFVSVGLNSNLDAASFERPPLNLVVVLDISGSMSSQFDQYYYDRHNGLNQEPSQEPETNPPTKMEVANRALVGLIDQLGPQDRLGVVLFDDEAYLAKPLRLVSQTDLEALRANILEITPNGGTNMEAGYLEGRKLLEQNQETGDEYDNRIIFLTDAMPNLGQTDAKDLSQLTVEASDNDIYTTFIGVGLDFNTELVESLTKARGSNYYSVHSEAEFLAQLDDNFDYMVTPVVFDLELKLESSGWRPFMGHQRQI